AAGAGGSHELAVRTPLDEPDSARLAHVLGDGLTGGRVPHAGDTVFRAGRDGAAVRTEAGPKHRALMPKRRQCRFPSAGIPKLCGVVGGRGKKPATVRAEGRAPTEAMMS